MNPADPTDFFRLSEVSITVIERSPTTTTAYLLGELDMDNTSEVESVLSRLLPESGNMFVDLSGVTFLGSAGIRALVQIHNECETLGVRFHVRNPAPMTRRVLEISGLVAAFDIPAGPPVAKARLVDVLFDGRA
jgi:anti-anti-sigma factor